MPGGVAPTEPEEMGQERHTVSRVATHGDTVPLLVELPLAAKLNGHAHGAISFTTLVLFQNIYIYIYFVDSTSNPSRQILF